MTNTNYLGLPLVPESEITTITFEDWRKLINSADINNSAFKIIDEAFENLATTEIKLERVTELPLQPDATTIYFLVKDAQATPVIYEEFVSINNEWISLGTNAKEVIANPVLSGDEEDLNGIEVDGVKYKINITAPTDYTAGQGITIEDGVISANFNSGYGISLDSSDTSYEISIDPEIVLTHNDIDVNEVVFFDDLDNTLESYERIEDAFSGDYNDLANKPDLSIYAESSDLATVATTGDYNDLDNKPSIPTDTSDLDNSAGFITKDVNDLTNYAQVYANVLESSTETLNNIKIGDSVYDISGGGSGSEYTSGYGISVDNDNHIINLNLEVSGESSDILELSEESGAVTLGINLVPNYNEEPTSESHLYNLKIGDTTYKLISSAGSGLTLNEDLPENTYQIELDPDYVVVANPPEQAQETLYTLQVGSTVYNIPSGGGSSYTAGTGINISNNEISIDSEEVATKTDLNDYELKSEAFSGSYDDLTNKPTIPDAVSGTNDGTNWTSLTIGNVTKNIPAGGSGGSYTAGTGIDITNNEISVDSDVAMKTDLPDAVSGTNDGTNWTSLTIGNDTYAIPSGGSSEIKTLSGSTITFGFSTEPGIYKVTTKNVSSKITIKLTNQLANKLASLELDSSYGSYAGDACMYFLWMDTQFERVGNMHRRTLIGFCGSGSPQMIIGHADYAHTPQTGSLEIHNITTDYVNRTYTNRLTLNFIESGQSTSTLTAYLTFTDSKYSLTMTDQQFKDLFTIPNPIVSDTELWAWNHNLLLYKSDGQISLGVNDIYYNETTDKFGTIDGAYTDLTLDSISLTRTEQVIS